MIEIFKSSKDGLQKIDVFEPGCWVNVVSPEEEDFERLKSFADLNREFVGYVKDPDEQPKTAKDKDMVFIVLRVPKESDTGELEFSTCTFGIFIYSDFFLTLSYDHKNEIINKLKVLRISTKKKIQTILKLFLLNSRSYLDALNKINKKRLSVQEELESNLRNEDFVQMMKLEKSLIYFSTSIKANSILIEKLVSNNLFTRFEDDRELLDDVIIENKQALEMASIYSNILNGMMNAFGSIISNKLNKTLKFLTSVTILIMIPTLVASIYGMNVKLPFQDNPHAFVMTALISLILCTIGIILFSNRDWF
jgi:magnesium transporter